MLTFQVPVSERSSTASTVPSPRSTDYRERSAGGGCEPPGSGSRSGSRSRSRSGSEQSIPLSKGDHLGPSTHHISFQQQILWLRMGAPFHR